MKLEEDGGAAPASASAPAAGAGGPNVAGGVQNFDPPMKKMARRKQLVEEACQRAFEKLKGKP